MATYRQIHVKTWASPDFQSVTPKAKLIFIHLFSNSHRNEAAIYRITTKTISNETDISTSEVEEAIAELEDAALVKYDKVNFIVWVVNAVKYQKTSPNEVIAIAKNLLSIDHPYCKEFTSYYKGTLSTLEGTIEVLTSTLVGTPGKGKGKGKGSNKGKKEILSKIDFAVFVKMTEKEHEKLIEEFGETKTAEMIERLNLYKGSKGKKYDSDYLTILSWDRKDKRNNPVPPKPTKPGVPSHLHEVI